MMPFRVLVADDHPHAREAIKTMLNDDDSYELVAEARNGLEAIRYCEEYQPDLVLMDIHMPECDGLEATRRIKQQFPVVKVIMLSVSDDIADLFRAVQFGAQGYLLKNMDPDDWISYIHSLMEGKSDLSRKLAGKMLYQFRETVETGEPLPEVLTCREREILMFIAQGDTNRHIGEQLKIAENTVKNHVKNILDKLKLENRVQLASYAVRHRIVQH
ncbi:MAG: response regulator [Clostridia bacterium]